ncbi:MAG: signal recognition particle-docking protein FtsY, partial [Nitrospirae bacterium]|nr:signal recognition particle-docking protein FtsY [Nitrospirota bacterium]
EKVKKGEIPDTVELKKALKDEIKKIIRDGSGINITADRPYVILTVGVNGTGKTTTIGKLAGRFANEGLKVILAAGDTFRAAAIEQLEIWAERSGVQIVKHKSGADPAAVAFDAVVSAKAKNADVVLVDTAGRLHTKINLMEELKKVKRVISRELPAAPHEVLLVVDATSGQNVIHQAKIFSEAVHITGIALTKLDGTARGGIVVAIKKELNIPVKLIGIGEAMDDLRDFNADEFVDALFE